MKLEEFKGSDFEFRGEKELERFIICGEHYPKVKIYFNKKTTEWFQFSEKGKLFRKTPPSNSNEIVEYGEKWDSLEQISAIQTTYTFLIATLKYHTPRWNA